MTLCLAEPLERRHGGREAGVGAAPRGWVPAGNHRGHRSGQPHHRAAQTEGKGESSSSHAALKRDSSLWGALLRPGPSLDLSLLQSLEAALPLTDPLMWASLRASRSARYLLFFFFWMCTAAAANADYY